MILVLVPVLFEVLCIALLAGMLFAADHDLVRLEHQDQAMFNINRIACSAARAVVDVGDIQKLDDPETANARVEEIRKSFGATALGAKTNAEEFPELREVLANLETLQSSILRYVSSVASRISDHSPAAANLERTNRESMVPLLIEFKGLSQQILALETEMITQAPQEVNSIRFAVFGTLAVLGLLSIVLAAALFYFFIDLIRRLDLISDNAYRLATGRALLPVGQGVDEIAELDRVLHDTDEVLRNARQHELSVLDNAVDVICALDSKLRFVAVNQASFKNWSYEPSDLLGMSLLNLLAEGTADNTRNRLREIVENAAAGELENIVKCGDGRLKDFLWTVSWSKEEERFSCVVHDVTEVRAMERLKQRFVAMVSHDLRSPLTAISMTIELALVGIRGEVSEPVIEELKNCDAQLGGLKVLIEELLEIEKIESKTLAIEPVCVRGFNVCAAAGELLKSAAQAKNIKIETPSASNDLLILGEEARLVQAVVKLLDNAIGRSPRNSTVTISLARLSDMVQISVADKGPRLSSIEANLVFERFRQGRSESGESMEPGPEATTRSALLSRCQGTRLGLSLVKAVVQHHGGKVGVDSNESGTSSFWFTIPAYQGDEQEEAAS